MEHSIASRYATRPKARFVQPSSRARERRLGLATVGFRAAPTRVTVLREPEPSPLQRLRASGHSLNVAPARLPVTGGPRPAVTVRWATTARTGPVRRPSAAPAPWRG